MRRTFHELISDYAANTGCTANIKEGTCQASLIIEGLEFQLGLAESAGMLFIQTGVALLPPEGREAFYEYLLGANDGFSGTQGLTLGVNKDMDLVTLQLSWDLGHLDAEGFARLMGHMGSLAIDWMVKLDAWRPEAPASADMGAVPDFHNFLRV